MTPLIYKTTADIKVPKQIYQQVLGQDESINIIKKAALQKRHVLLIGEPGTGKSLIGLALAELLPKEKLVDVLVFPNDQDENVPLIRTFPKGEGKKLVTKLRLQSMTSFKNQSIIMLIVIIIVTLFPYYLWKTGQISDIIYAASMITSMIFLVGFIIFLNIGRKLKSKEIRIPKLLIDNSGKTQAPFIDATGSHAGALLGDCLHDPLQCFPQIATISKIIQINSNQLQIKEEKVEKEINYLLKKNKSGLIKQKDYLAVFLDKDELNVLGEKENNIETIRVLSINRHKNKHPYLIKLTTESGKEIIVTPEHKIATSGKIEKKWVEASKLKKGEKVFVNIKR